MYLALSYDHRIVDGKGAVTFLVRVKEALEDPRAEPDVSRDDGPVCNFRKNPAHIVDNQGGKVGSRVGHRHHDALEHDFRIGSALFDLVVDSDDLGEAFEAEIFALEGHDELIRSGQGRGHQHAERGRAVEKEIIRHLGALEGLQDAPQADEMVIGAGQLDLAAGEFQIRGDQGEIRIFGRDDEAGEVGAIDQA
jgi:hypothetical protein